MRCLGLLLCILDLCACVTDSSYYGPIWSYDDENKWPGSKCREGGRRQSPIDIRTSSVIRDYNKDFIKHGALRFVGYEKVLVSAVNNGHTVQFSTEGDMSMHPTIAGGPLNHEYRLEQLHFHWLSEHAVNGVKYPMEIHFVHVRADLPVMDALKKRNGLAIISVFCTVQTELDDNQPDPTDEIMQYIPDLLETGDRISGLILDMTKLLGHEWDSYYTYAGSLTSPQCNEAVIWIISSKPLSMSDAQYRLFGKIGIGRHNFRSLQKLNRHQVFAPASTRFQTPQMIIFFEKVVKLVAEFFKNVTSFMSKGFNSR